VTDLVGVEFTVAVLGASLGLFLGLGGGQVSLRPKSRRGKVRT
jgi:hypothetical protein